MVFIYCPSFKKNMAKDFKHFFIIYKYSKKDQIKLFSVCFVKDDDRDKLAR